MAVVHGLVLTLALLAVVCLPVVVAALILADELVDHLADRAADRWQARQQRRTIDRLDRAFEVDSLVREVDLTEFERVRQPAIEQIAADLRRLSGQRLGIGSRSPVWHSAVLEAYDDRLRLASRCLGVAEHLSDLDGIDLAIERVRVEGELQAAGLVLPAPDVNPGRRTS
ncbi:hypothetical protein [Plantactinospora sp. CA-290183]|uniref:hypothetical protein n=1 Tax=Plantactinospora sp. CA-290183 TaxID=3240006 RepID=UPI003D8CF558